jgi:hypothetical protein
MSSVSNNKILVSLPQITPPPKINSNAALLTDISRFLALNPKEMLAFAVYFRAKELANDASSPLTNYDPDVAADRSALVQDAKTVFGNIPARDLRAASLAIDWTNSKAVYAALPSDVDAISVLDGVKSFRERSEDELRRILMYLRLEIGE